MTPTPGLYTVNAAVAAGSGVGYWDCYAAARGSSGTIFSATALGLATNSGGVGTVAMNGAVLVVPGSTIVVECHAGGSSPGQVVYEADATATQVSQLNSVAVPAHRVTGRPKNVFTKKLNLLRKRSNGTKSG